jgi:branched-chain amino acid aminotransferase
MRIYHVDGEFVPADKAVIPVDDLSIIRGYGVCDVMRTFNGRPYFLKEHIKRLENSADQIGLYLPWSTNDLINIVLETLKRNKIIDEVNIRIIVTGGSSPDFFYPQDKPRLLIIVTDISHPPECWYKDGIKVTTSHLERTVPGAKLISYIPAVMALKKAKLSNALEAIYVNHDNEALEGTTSNLFAFFGNTLITPAKGVLKGITRQAVLDLASDLYKIKEEVIRLEDLLKADEIFVTGTSKGAVPVIQVDETIIGSGMPGKRTKKIISSLATHSFDFIKDKS